MNFPPFLYEPGVKGMAGSLIERVAFRGAILTFTAAAQQQFTPQVPLDKVQALEYLQCDVTVQGAETITGFWELLDGNGARRQIGVLSRSTYVIGAVNAYVLFAQLLDGKGPLFLLPNWRAKININSTAAVDNKTMVTYAHGWTFPRGSMGDAL